MSVQPARHNFKIWRGATFRYKFTYLEGAAGSPPMNLTGYTANMEIKDPTSSTTLLGLTTANGGIIIDAMNGTIEIFITATQTNTFYWRQANYTLSLIHGDEIDPLLYGSIVTTGF